MTTPILITLPTGLPVGDVNVYLFTNPEVVLVDTGVKSEESLSTLETALAEHNLTLADLSKVIISHPHIDHVGLAGTIAAKSKADFYVFEQTVPWLVDFTSQWQNRTAFFRTFLQQIGLPSEIRDPIMTYFVEIESHSDSIPSERINSFKAGDFLEMGGLAWQVLHTPGHASTLTCFYQAESKQFLSTDMLLPLTPTPIVEPPPPGQTERVPSLPQFIQSLTMLESLEIGSVYPGHGEPFDNAHELIKFQKERIQHRKLECLALIESGVNTIMALLLKMYADYPPKFRFAGLWMLIGYLDLLQAEGNVVETSVDGVLAYKVAG